MHKVLLSDIHKKIRKDIGFISPGYTNLDGHPIIWFDEKKDEITIVGITIEIDSETLSFGTKSIEFRNCVFSENSLQIKGFNNFKRILKFESCTFEMPVNFSGEFEDVIFCVKDKKNKFEKNLKIQGIFRQLKLDNIEVNDKVDITNVIQSGIDDTFKISNSVFNNDCRILRNHFQNFCVENSSFCSLKSSDEDKGIKDRKSLEIDANEFKKDVILKNITINVNNDDDTFALKSSLKIYDNTFEGSINIEEIDTPNLEIDISFLQAKKRLTISNDKNDRKIEKLIFKKLPPRTYLENLNIGELDLNRNTIEDKEILSLTNLKINLLKIENFINYGFFTINNIKPNRDDKIIISNSTLGKLDLVSCDLSNVNLQIDNSKLVDIFYTDTTFPDEIGSSENGNAKLVQQRDTYGQLKVVSEKVGNRFKALEFQAKEMAAYYESIGGNSNKTSVITKIIAFLKGILNIIKGKIWTEERITLWAMKWSNNFRQSWARGIIFTFLVGIIPFIFLVVSLDYIDLCWNCWSETKEVFYEYFGKYFEFLNPAHKSDFLLKGKEKGEIDYYFWDFLGRIVIGFGIYQTIQAFRKFGKE